MPESSTTITQFEHTHTTFDKLHPNTTIQDSKYKRKGYGFIMSIIITFAFFFITPRILGLIFPSLASGYDPIWFISFSCASLHAISNILCYSVYYLIYRVKSPFFEKYKISNEPWPWESNRAEWIKQLKKAAGLYSINNFVIGPVMILSILLLTGCKLRTTIDSLPTTKEIIIQILFCTFVEDLYSYLGHRLMHTKYLYPHFHKIHHQSNKTVSITNEFAHPIEFALVNLLASLLGPKLLGSQMHLITTWMWILVRVAESVDAHGGYDFSWSPFKLMPLGVSPTYHDFHHSENLGNFGSMFTIWDTVFKTNRDYWDSQAKQKKDSQVDIQRRVKTMVQDSLSVKPLIQTMQESEVQNITQSGDKKND